MTITIAMAGKGGTGKTSLASLIIRYLLKRHASPILAVDADANANLADHVCTTCGIKRSFGFVYHRAGQTWDPREGLQFGTSAKDENHWWDNGRNAIAFSRGNKGFVAINRESTVVTATVATGMPPGTYCDLLTGGLSGVACVGTPVVVDATGAVQLDLQPNTAIAIDGAAKL